MPVEKSYWLFLCQDILCGANFPSGLQKMLISNPMHATSLVTNLKHSTLVKISLLAQGDSTQLHFFMLKSVAMLKAQYLSYQYLSVMNEM